jgi:predicted ABC-type ATPase
VARVRGRVREAEHDVPESKIRSRYIKALKLLPQIVDGCDKVLIYDNSVMPSLVYKKDEKGNDYFPTDI